MTATVRGRTQGLQPGGEPHFGRIGRLDWLASPTQKRVMLGGGMLKQGLRGLAVLAMAGGTAMTIAPAVAQAPICGQLERQLAALDNGGGNQRARELAARQKAELDRMLAMSQSLGCERRLSIFGPAPSPQCADIGRNLTRLRIDVDRLNAQAQRSAGVNDPVRRQLTAALAQNNCGPQYRSAAVQQQRRSAGLLGMLFGGEASEDPSVSVAPPSQIIEEEAPRSSTFRTVCVRSCDGFFFPISYTTSQSSFPRDEAICRMTCPGTEAQLFAYPNPGGAIEQAVSPTGAPYTQLPNAFRYRTEYVSGCSCRPEGMSWAQALQGVDDQTLRKGDIVVDEARSQALSQPGAKMPAAPPPTRTAQPRQVRPAAPPPQEVPEMPQAPQRPYIQPGPPGEFRWGSEPQPF